MLYLPYIFHYTNSTYNIIGPRIHGDTKYNDFWFYKLNDILSTFLL